MNDIVFGTILLTAIMLVLTTLVIAARRYVMASRPMVITVNNRTKIQSMTGTKLLDALHAGGIQIPSTCAGVGTCGLCRVRVPGDDLDVLPTEAARFTRSELAHGMHLACQVVLRGDIEVEIDEALLGAETYQCTVISNRFLTPLIRELVLELPQGKSPDIEAGAFFQVTAEPFSLNFASIEVPDAYQAAWNSLRSLTVTSQARITRAYSIANGPKDAKAGRIVMNIRLALPPPSSPDVPPGIVSSWLFGLSDGARVEISGPFGNFHATDSDREMVFIGGGVGMAPLRSIIHDQLDRVQTNRKISYFYGARNTDELFYTDEFHDLAARHANFSFTIALSDLNPQDSWTGTRGFVHDVVFEQHLKDHPAPEDCEYYLCGPPLMIKAVMAMLDAAGVDPATIFNDDFGG